MFDLILDYFNSSTIITFFVLFTLSVYFIVIIWIFIYKYLSLAKLINNEKESLYMLINKKILDQNKKDISVLNDCISKDGTYSKEVLDAFIIALIRESSVGISWLSIIASTSPFIGLFGTVVGILESFSKFSIESQVSFSIIAPAISEALVATAAGIFVAIFAYTFHQLINRKIYEYDTYLNSRSKLLLKKI